MTTPSSPGIFQRLSSGVANLIKHIPFAGKYLYEWIITIKWQSVAKSGVLLLTIGYVLFYIKLKQQNCIYQYTHLPDDLTRQGFTDRFVIKQIEHIRRSIIEYRPEFRESELTQKDKKKKPGDGLKNLDAFTSEQMETIEHMEIGGISIETLIVLTDKLVSVFDIDSDNYMTLEYAMVAPGQLQLSLSLGKHRAVFQDTIHEGNIHLALTRLNLLAAKTVLQKKNPSVLMDYYYDQSKYDECELVCQQTLMESNDREAIGNAYGYLGILSENYGFYEYALREAGKRNPEWISIKKLLDVYNEANVEDAFDELVSDAPGEYPFQWGRLQYHFDSSEVGEYQKIKACIADIKKSIPEYSSTVHYSYGIVLSDWGKEKMIWHDSATREIRTAINMERKRSESRTPNAKLLADYYNSMAYAFKGKILATVKKNQITDTTTAKSLLDSANHYLKQSLLTNPRNPWALITQAECSGIKAMLNRNDDTMKAFRANLIKAMAAGYEVSDWTLAPYHLLGVEKSKEITDLALQKRIPELKKELIMLGLMPTP
ncbi:MAG TPA: hypothetical protein PLX35_11575 [Cyclobacteriaceae bacterium]|nr:hypothetical protein [Cyclobacteriaceae bacterium]